MAFFSVCRLQGPFTLETNISWTRYLRGRLNILKRVLIHIAALNLALLMRVLVGVGTPRSLQGRVCGLFSRLVLLWRQIGDRYCSGSLAARLVTICSIIISATVYF
jgi:hypothetical protein